jgi:ribosome-associated translation inhibitor RaiA
MEDTRSQQDRIVAQITLNCNGAILRGEERAPTINAAIDAVAEILDNRARRLKGKPYRNEQAKKSGKASSIRAPEPTTESSEEEDP